ncbi:MAG: UbiA family prenyltransferase, partial [Candidatus Omnitrophota bacterium]|nr:UbiA family prenyltransferase [Candidatus Omnitrophota bacterium]
HPEKSRRPIAAGRLKSRPAIIASALLMLAGLSMAWSIYFKLFLLVAGFILLHILYDVSLKHIVVVDVFVIAFSFIIRLFSGVVMSPIENKLSSWILFCTFLLALFLALCKRRAEMAMLQDVSKHHRRSLADYSVQFLDQMIAIIGGCAILSYSIYALSADTIAKRGTDKLVYTIPFVVYGIFRYLYLVNIRRGGTNPEKLLLRDIPLLTDIILYCIIVYLVLYFI